METKSRLLRRAALLTTVIGFSFAAFSVSTHQAVHAANDTFKARATLGLCPDYPFGGVTVSLKYRLPGQTAYQPVTVTSQQINSSNNTGTFNFTLPSTLGTAKLSVAAFCTNAAGESRASNELQISNCDALALVDTDGDGLMDNQEDVDCGNSFSPGDYSNLYNVDTDGDGVRDLVELVSATDPTNPGSSPRPYVFLSSPFDPDGDGVSNPVAWRKSNGYWFIKDLGSPGNNVAIQFGGNGDVPFAYEPRGAVSDVGVVRRVGNSYHWLFHGAGFNRSNAAPQNDILFGIFGDNIIPGPWEEAGVTSPAVARLYNNMWSFDIYLRDGTVKEVNWGGNGDVPKVQDYDGDGIFDIAVFRPSAHKTFVIQSSNGLIKTYDFGTGTAEFTVRGDYTGDGIDDISFWEPTTGLFTMLTSTNGFNDTLGNQRNPNFYKELQLGTYSVNLPLSWNRHGGKLVFTVVDHTTAERLYKSDNNPNGAIVREQWGIAGDSLG
ncbi:MAG: hypothetical protein U0136_05280 [Bdellovibrionota bacterium]